MQTRAYVYGTSKGGYDIIRADAVPGSRQMLPDKFEEHYGKQGLIRPPYAFDTLQQLFELDTWHRRAIIQKAFDVSGLGWDIVEDPLFIDADKRNTDDQKRLIEFFSTCSHDLPLEDLLEAIWVDYDVLGNAAIEVVRNGLGEPVELFHVPFKTVRIHRTKKLYAQVRGGHGDEYRNIVWFLDFDHPISEIKPQDYPTKSFNPNDLGEIIHFKSYDSRSSFYGIPESISAVGAMAANMAVSDYNLGRLNNRGVPDYIMTLEGVELDNETQTQITEFLRATKDKKLADGPKILTAELGQGKATFEKITPENEDANWLKYRFANRDEILAAHGMPKYRIGIAEVGSMGQSVSQEQSRIYAMGIIKHRRRRIEHLLNDRIVHKGLQIHGWKIQFSELDIRNEQQEAETDARRTGLVPVETINEVRRKRGIGDDLLGGDRIVMRVGHEVIEVGRKQGAAPFHSPIDPSLPPEYDIPDVILPTDSAHMHDPREEYPSFAPRYPGSTAPGFADYPHVHKHNKAYHFHKDNKTWTWDPLTKMWLEDKPLEGEEE